MDLFSRIASRYESIVGSFDYEKLRDFFPINSEELILDLGGGTGRVAIFLKKEANDCLIFDRSFEMLQQSRNHTNDFLLVQGKSETLPFRKNSFGQIFINDTLHHVQNQEKTLNECNAILLKQGQVIIREFDRKYFWNLLLILFEKIMRFKSKFYSPKELQKLCEELNLDVYYRRPSKATFVLVGQKK